LTGQTVHFNAVLAGLDNIYLEHMTVDKCRQCGDPSVSICLRHLPL
jgi:hypothetical protein